ncbi:MAG: hypothetical protein HZA19_00520 [Nitrospirae bacterium]|nr:hypothetical protein [Nitrospirota bacterium]
MLYRRPSNWAHFTLSFTTTVEAYDPVSNTWTSRARMPLIGPSLSADAVNGILYVHGKLGGIINALDPVSDKWFTKSPMPAIRMDQTVRVIDGHRFAIGNDSVDGFIEVAVYDPVTDKWNPQGFQ